MAKKILQLTERPATIGGSINTRTEHHGEELVPAGDIPLAGIMLNQAEFDALSGEGTHARLFAKAEGGAIEPAMPDLTLDPVAIAGKFEDSQVTLEVEGNTATLHDVTIAKCRGVRQVGGNVELSCVVQTILAPIDVRKIMGKTARVQLNFGPVPEKDQRQANLALNEGAKAA